MNGAAKAAPFFILSFPLLRSLQVLYVVLARFSRCGVWNLGCRSGDYERAQPPFLGVALICR